MKNDKDNQLIEDYIDGIPEGKELEAFQKRLETDKAFAREYELRKNLARLWKDAYTFQETKDEVGHIMQQEKQSVFNRYRKAWYYVAVAASIALLIGIYWLFVRPDNSKHLHRNEMAEVADSVIFHRDKPEKLAKVRYNIQLISPVNDQQYTGKDTLVFRWTAPVDTVNISFGIMDSKTRRIVFRSGVSLSDAVFTLYPGMLPPGKYAWYLQDTMKMNHFTIK